MAKSGTDWILEAFAGTGALSNRVLHAYRNEEARVNDAELLRDIAELVVSFRNRKPEDQIPIHKKRKLNLAEHAQERSTDAPNGSHDLVPKVYFECKDVSFITPARKKMRLQFVRDEHNLSMGQIRLLLPNSDKVEYSVRREDVADFFYLPVPDKPTRQRNFVIIPLPGSISHDGTPLEAIAFTMNETKGRPDTYGVTASLRAELEDTTNDTLASLTLAELDHFMAEIKGQKTVQPDEKEFASVIPQSHRKGEKAYHVKAFKGSKEGYLFFLPNGILFGFKKPIQFFSFANIDSTAFTSVLLRTFNLTVTAREPSASEEEAESKSYEFSMIDQADFAGIDEYIKRHGLNDASMAADRRAKVHNVNKVKGENGELDREQVNGVGESELAKAEMELQDAEDEEEEDYDPSGGESEGEGEESGEEGYENAGDVEEMEDEDEEEEEEE